MASHGRVTDALSTPWETPSVGTHSHRKATDNLGASTVSSSITMIVNNNTPPSVSLSAPLPGEVFIPGVPVTLSANATDSDGTIDLVEFFEGETRLGSASAPPYEIAHDGFSPGPHSILARARDNLGAVITSAPVQFRVNTPPTGLTVLFSPSAFTRP
jgi:hypothetical protein